MNLTLAGRKMVIMIGVAAAIFIAVGAAVYILVGTLPSLESLPFALGVVLTSALNVLKVILLERTVKRTIDMSDPNAGKNYVRIQYLLRYFLTAAILLVAGLTPFINVWGAVCGIFTLQVSVFTVRMMKLDADA